jgi:excisionase family DNA binding protein
MRNFVNGAASLAPSSTSQKLDFSLDVDERLFTAQEVAERLGVSERWVRDHATRRKPRLRAIKLGPLLRFRWSDVQAMVAQQATEKPLNCR